MRLQKGIAVAAVLCFAPTLAMALRTTPQETLRARPSATAIEVLADVEEQRMDRDREKDARKAAKKLEKQERQRAKELRKDAREREKEIRKAEHERMKDLREAERERAKDLREAERERRKQR